MDENVLPPASPLGASLSLALPKNFPERLRATQARLARVGWDQALPKVSVSAPEKRWGSAAKDGTIRINWRVLQAPVTLVDYVLVHELTHLIHEDHSREFWATVGRVMPDYENRKTRLRELGPGLVR
jgi:predicted metal-dependent hydrolase